MRAKIYALFAALFVIGGTFAGIVATAAPANATTNLYYVSDDYHVDGYLTQNGSAGDGYVHASAQCSGCNSDEISFYAVNGNSNGSNTVQCGVGGNWWPFTYHSLD